MSWLNLRRLLPPGKLWKVFTNKLQIKLHKLNRSKPNKKPKTKIQSHKISKKLGWPSLSIQPKQFKLKTNPHTFIHHQKRHKYYLKKGPPPVYVDQLFTLMKERPVHSPVIAVEEAGNKEKSCSSSKLKKSDQIFYQNTFQGESSKEDRRVADYDNNINMNTADDLWESLLLDSPQMHGINERAEEFIARFRAEMHHQETLARR